jgi:transposase InsO family protein
VRYANQLPEQIEGLIVRLKAEKLHWGARKIRELLVATRFLLLCEALESTREDTACTAFERLFRERGLPFAIRSDNGVPFASPNALFNLSKLSVWWPRLGIAIERIKPGHPQ